MSRLHEPFTLPKHNSLLMEINNTVIALKAWHQIDWTKESLEAEDKLKAHNPAPTYDELIDLLQRCHKAINEQREDPRKY